MTEAISETNKDWLIEDYTSNQAKDAVLLSMTALIQIAQECCNPPLSLEDAKDLMETVWLGMESNHAPI